MDSSVVTDVANDLNAKATAYTKQRDEKSRRELRETARKLSASLESPVESFRQTIFQLHRSAAVRTAIEGGWFEALAGGEPQTATQLASATGAQSSLLVRIMRVLTAEGIVEEPDVDTYAANEKTRAYTIPGLRDGVKHFFDQCGPSLVKLPQYLANTSFREPIDIPTGPYAFAHGMSFWKLAEERPRPRETFNSFMTMQKEGRGNWVDLFPVEERLAPSLREDPDAVLLVDVGGGRGHDLEDFKARYGHGRLPGRLVLEDLPATLADVRALEKEGIELREYDFFTQQPVTGARVYYFRSILHDWPDEECRQILRNTKSAMAKGYSSILINDIVLPDRGAPAFGACLDLSMMAVLSGKERTRKEWSALLSSVGLAIVDIWTLEEGGESIIETVLKD
ncbi:MAG: hypothetical protein M1837_004054 [Sclerophora amabilis]|nr:MAG: hypothetical protein M1837_004054 [Sclerophora amabilis]